MECNKSQKRITSMYVFYFISGIICESTIEIEYFVCTIFHKHIKKQPNPELSCMFGTVFDVSRWGYHEQRLEERFKLHSRKTATVRSCLGPWLPCLHNQSSYNENETNHYWIPSLLSGTLSPHPFPPNWMKSSDISAWEWRIEAGYNVCSLAFSFSPCSCT